MDERISIERALLQRGSSREFGTRSVTLADVSQLLWAAQGIIHESVQRTAPSAGALHPLSVYVAAGDVQSLDPGLYEAMSMYRTSKP